MRGVGRGAPNLGVRGGGIVKRGAPSSAAQMMQGRGGMIQSRGGMPVRGAPQASPRGRGATSTVSSKGAISITHVRDGAPPPPKPPPLRAMRPGPGPQQVIYNLFFNSI